MTYPLSRLGGSNGGGLPTAIGLRFPSTSVYAVSAASAFAQAYKWFRVIWAPNIQMPNALTFVAGTENGGGGQGVSLVSSSLASPGYAVGQLTGFDGNYSGGNAIPLHVLATSEIGRYRVTDLVLDDTNDLFYHYELGRLIRTAVASLDTNWSSTTALGVNTRPGGPGTFQFGDVTIFEIQASTYQPTPAEVRSFANVVPGTAVTGSTRLFIAAEATPGASTWTDPRSGTVLTVTGTTTRHILPRVSKTAGMVSIFGESHVMRDQGVNEGDGFRKGLMFRLLDSGITATANGFYTFGPNVTKTYDPRHFGVPGQAIAVVNGAVQPRLSDFATRLLEVAPDGSIVLQGGTNDAFVYCVTQALSVAAAKSAYFTALDTLVTQAAARMDAGRPIIVPDTLRLGTSAIVNNNQRDFLVEVAQDLPAWIAARVGTYPGLRLAPVQAAITPNQSAADANLVDGTHMNDASRDLFGQVVADAIVSAL